MNFNPNKCHVMHIGHSLDTKYYTSVGGVVNCFEVPIHKAGPVYSRLVNSWQARKNIYSAMDWIYSMHKIILL